jgi:DnaJ-domain-containing protein 1
LTWAHCTACGAEAPLPERCVECRGKLDQAECAARCEVCRHLVCGECFGNYALAAQGETVAKELLLCLTCAGELDAQPVAEDEEDDEEPAEDSGAEDTAEAEAEADAREAEAAAEAADEAQGPAEPPPESAWDVLGVAPGVPLAEIRQAYLRLVSQYHPDKVAQLGPKLQALALEETRRLNLAWSELRERVGGG